MINRFFFKRFHVKTAHSGWQICFFGFSISWSRWINHPQLKYWRCSNFSMIIYKNRCLSWTMPNINGKNKIQLNDLVVTPKGLKKITRVVCEATRFDIDGIGGSIAINEGGMDKLIYKSTKFQRIRYKYFFINTYSINK